MNGSMEFSCSEYVRNWLLTRTACRELNKSFVSLVRQRASRASTDVSLIQPIIYFLPTPERQATKRNTPLPFPSPATISHVATLRNALWRVPFYGMCSNTS